MTSASIIIPVRDGSHLLRPALETLLRECTPADEIIVVDDCSRDGLKVPNPCQLLRNEKPLGPYASRNLAASQSTRDLLIFVDVRTRVSPGWRSKIDELFSDAGVGVACTEVRTLSGPRLAERAAASQQSFSLRHYVNQVPPYYPTCNLAVRRSAFLSVGGFEVRRSGGDLALCAKIQSETGLRLSASPEPLATWQPRATILGILRQWTKYGRGHYETRANQQPHKVGFIVARQLASTARAFLKTLWTERSFMLAIVVAATQMAFLIGYLSVAEWPGQALAVRLGSKLLLEG